MTKFKSILISVFVSALFFSCSQPTDYNSSNIDSSEIWLRIQKPSYHYEYNCDGKYVQVPENYDFMISLMYTYDPSPYNKMYKIFYDVSEFNDNALELYETLCKYDNFKYNTSKYDCIGIYNRSRTYCWSLNAFGKTKSGQIAWLYTEGETDPDEVEWSFVNATSEQIRVK